MKHQNPQIEKLLSQREEVSSSDLKVAITQAIVTILKQQHDRYDPSTPSKHVMLHEQRQQSDLIRRKLEQRGVIQPTNKLRPETRRNEISDTTMTWYLQMLMVSDSSDYRARNQELISNMSSHDREMLQREFIDAIPMDISTMTDREVIDLFSAATEHAYHEGDNIRHYRNQAIQYIPHLKKSLQQAKPITLADGSTSYKICSLAGGKILEFVYRNYLNTEKHQDKYVTIRTYDSLQESHQTHSREADKMKEITEDLQNIYEKYKDITWSQDDITSLVSAVENIYDGKYTHISQERFQRSIENARYLHKNQYHMMFGAILTDIQESIKQLNAMAKRYRDYDVR